VPDYRLAPEHPFPAALEDAVDAYRWLITEAEVDPRNMVLAGDSAGGGLALAAMLRLRGDDIPLPAGAVAISPWVDLALTGESLDTRADADLTVTKADLERKAREYLDGADPREPLASPLYGDLTGVPPLLVVAGADEALLDDSIRLVRKAGIAGIQTTLLIEPEMQHVFPISGHYVVIGSNERRRGKCPRRLTSGLNMSWWIVSPPSRSTHRSSTMRWG
jgi:acetyl esterase/lipase